MGVAALVVAEVAAARKHVAMDTVGVIGIVVCAFLAAVGLAARSPLEPSSEGFGTSLRPLRVFPSLVCELVAAALRSTCLLLLLIAVAAYGQAISMTMTWVGQ